MGKNSLEDFGEGTKDERMRFYNQAMMMCLKNEATVEPYLNEKRP